MLFVSTAGGEVQQHILKNTHFNVRKEKSTCAQSPRPRSLTPAWASSETSSPQPTKSTSNSHNCAVSVRILSLFSYFLMVQVSRAFLPLSPSLLFSELILTSFFWVADPLGWAEWLDRELGRAPGLQGEGNAREGTGPGSVSQQSWGHPLLRMWGPMTCNKVLNVHVWPYLSSFFRSQSFGNSF